jgi:kynurenine formamidase
MRIVDLSIVIEDSMAVYPGDREIKIVKTTDGYVMTHMSLGSHTGTHVDLPLHCIDGGKDTSSMPLERFFGQAVMLRLNDPRKAVEDTKKIKKGDIVIIDTGWGAKLGSDAYYENIPGISMELADALIKRGIKALGTDMPSVDEREELKVHRRLLSHDIVIFECLVRLDEIRSERFDFIGLPLKIKGGDGCPVRAIAIINK